MISWVWIPVAACVGACLGVLAACGTAAGRITDADMHAELYRKLLDRTETREYAKDAVLRRCRSYCLISGTKHGRDLANDIREVLIVSGEGVFDGPKE